MVSSSSRPRIAVLVPAYNAEDTIVRALNSLALDKEPHDIVVVDDGSKVPLESWLAPRPNLTILRLSKNGGVTKARNMGLNYILGQGYEFMACLDADDVSKPERLGLLRAFLDARPDVGFAGGWGRFVSEKGETVYHFNPPQDNEAIMRSLFYNFCFVHSSMMFRTSLLREAGGYNESYPSAEDYEFIRRLAARTKSANLPNYLVDYTISGGGISMSRRRQQLTSRLKIQWAYRNWHTPHFYFGIAKTLSLGLLPYSLVKTMKKHWSAYRQRG